MTNELRIEVAKAKGWTNIRQGPTGGLIGSVYMPEYEKIVDGATVPFVDGNAAMEMLREMLRAGVEVSSMSKKPWGIEMDCAWWISDGEMDGPPPVVGRAGIWADDEGLVIEEAIAMCWLQWNSANSRQQVPEQPSGVA